MSEHQEPCVQVDGEEIIGCAATDQSAGEEPAHEEAAIAEEERLQAEYEEIEETAEEETNADSIPDSELEEEEDD